MTKFLSTRWGTINPINVKNAPEFDTNYTNYDSQYYSLTDVCHCMASCHL